MWMICWGGGGDSEEEVIELRKQLSGLLGQAGFKLRKFRSNSSQVLREIPQELVEPLPKLDLVDSHTSKHPKALGIRWDSHRDTMAVDVSNQAQFEVIRRGVLGDISRTFDVLGWINPVILPMKLLMQELWSPTLDWDTPLPEPLRLRHKLWREELELLADLELPRCYFVADQAEEVCLHGFADASEKAFGAVIYIRASYKDHPPTVRLVMAKNRVLPLKEKRTIPELELSAAVLLAELLQTVQQTLGLEASQVVAWSDSTTVLCWLQSVPTKYKVFVANRITTATEYFPPSMWHYVPTGENPADCASRGTSAGELKVNELWWNGPKWLSEDPIVVPKQPHKQEIESEGSVGLKASCLPVSTVAPPCGVWLEDRFRSYDKLVRVMAWLFRSVSRFKGWKSPRYNSATLSVTDVEEAELFLLKRAQRRTFMSEFKSLTQSPPQVVHHSSKILSLHPFVAKDGLLHVGGRLSEAFISQITKHPIILSAKDALTERLFEQAHVNLCHCGPTLLMSDVGGRFYCTGARLLAKRICHQCLHCRKIQARAQEQLMGQLPKSRVTPAPFATTGLPIEKEEGGGSESWKVT